MTEADRIASLLCYYDDYPRPGVKFIDILPLLADAEVFRSTIDQMVEPWAEVPIDQVVAIEARGLLFGAPIALALGAGMIMVRKPGKLPGPVDRYEYTSEYATDDFEVSTGLVEAGARYLFVDDVLAVGGVSSSTAAYLESCGATLVGFSFLVEIGVLDGRSRLEPLPVESVLRI